MTKREAKKLVRATAATLLRTEVDNGSGWISDDDKRSEADVTLIEEALCELADRLEAGKRP